MHQRLTDRDRQIMQAANRRMAEVVAERDGLHRELDEAATHIARLTEQINNLGQLATKQQAVIEALEHASGHPAEMHELFVAAARLLVGYRQADQERIAALEGENAALRGNQETAKT